MGFLSVMADGEGDGVGSVPSAEESLKRLTDGNVRFYSGHPKHPHGSTDWRNKLEWGQHPFAVVVGCSDSRVPPELIFDQGLGDIFVIRVAGNVVDTDVAASVEYAVDHLGTGLVVVLGHTGCGAVTAALDLLSSAEGEAAEVIDLLSRIEPAVIGLGKEAPRKERIDQGVRNNIKLAVRRLGRVPDLRRSLNVKEGQNGRGGL
jgi:carbonic anhydrase